MIRTDKPYTTCPECHASFHIGSLLLDDKQRGKCDALRFDAVRELPDGWKAVLKTGGDAWILQRVTSAYLDGLQEGGCVVLLLGNEPRMAA